jgi:hypothetical protein
MHVSSRRLVPATLLALLASLLLAVPARAADTGSISGIVTARPSGGTAAPYAGASILFDRLHETGGNDNALVRAESDSAGHFSVAGVPDGRYQIRTYPKVYGELGEYGYEYYDDRSSPYGATEVVVAGGAVTLAHPIELQPIGKVVGTVRNEAGQPMAGVYVGFSQGNGGGYSTVTDAQGRYDSLEGEWSGNLIPGDYVAEASPSGYEADDPQYYYDTHPVTVRPGVATVQDITMRERPRVVFTVLDTDGKPLANAPLLFKVRTDGGAWDWPQYGPNETDAQGRYRFIDNFDEFKIQFGLPAGYRGTGVPEYWEDAYTFDDAKVLSFPDGVAKSRSYTVQLTTGRTYVSQAASGKRLTADPGSWGPEVTDRAYQWLANDAAIAGATQPTYVVTNKVAGKRISVRIAGTLPNGDRVTTTSTVTKRAIGKLTSHRPKIKGKLRPGKRLVASVKAWSPARVKLAFQWLRDGKPVKKRTARTYRLSKADVGHKLSVRVVGRKASYATATVKSAATAKVRR